MLAKTEPLGRFSSQKPVDGVDYYDKIIAPRMVWFDSEKNIYRRYILPLAQTNECVRLAIEAVSAQHAVGDLIDSVPEEVRLEAQTNVTHYRNEAVKRITDFITNVTDQVAKDEEFGLYVDDAEWILATMLVLSCYEMAHSGAEAAEFHRKAARSLVATLSMTDHRKSKFLPSMRNKLSTYEVFGCTTSFDLQSIQDAVLSDPADEMEGDDETTLFSGFLNMLHEVTMIGRCVTAPSGACRDWKAEFEITRGVTLMAIGRHSIKTPAHRRDLIRLVDIHYNAALLYVFRCLGPEAFGDVETTISDLLRQVNAMEDIDYWVQNLPWPLFIAGTESYGDPDRQIAISRLYMRIRYVTGLRHYQDVLSFLDAFWSGAETDWQVLARDWEASGRRILAY
ncbi:hypothetical protein N7520_003830 [Penicillium odoratum]|uniref:uncharacterized protein n=1 Tax=Penicillium odoratum TaxID=1167516 RepID=UPI002548BC63|nr:uncharacterized protein N7520_003830 [Penicillium odoratum]KAJ5769271.1 hypothetical protein N7520_003830 [Penicillium odoratum]